LILTQFVSGELKVFVFVTLTSNSKFSLITKN